MSNYHASWINCFPGRECVSCLQVWHPWLRKSWETVEHSPWAPYMPFCPLIFDSRTWTFKGGYFPDWLKVSFPEGQTIATYIIYDHAFQRRLPRSPSGTRGSDWSLSNVLFYNSFWLVIQPKILSVIGPLCPQVLPALRYIPIEWEYFSSLPICINLSTSSTAYSMNMSLFKIILAISVNHTAGPLKGENCFLQRNWKITCFHWALHFLTLGNKRCLPFVREMSVQFIFGNWQTF